MDPRGFVVLFVFLFWGGHSEAEVRKPFCPRSCLCDTFEGLKRADCSQQQLINAQTDVPNMVEILDLSRNDISQVDDHSFEVRKESFIVTIHDADSLFI